MRKPAKSLTTLAIAGALALGASACGSSSSGGSSAAAGSSTAPTSAPSASPTPAAQISDLSAHGGATAVTLDSGFLAALKSLKVTPAPVGKAKISNGVIVFPITGGNVTYYLPSSGVTPYVQGSIVHKGSGLSLTAGGKTISLTNFVVDPGQSMLFGDVAVNGKSAASNAPLFFLDGRTLQPLTTQNNAAILAGTKVELSPTAASLLNQQFNITALKPYLLVGVAKIAVATA